MDTQCLISGNHKFKVLGRMELPKIGIKYIKKCKNCRLIRVDPLPTIKDLLGVYDANYFCTDNIAYGFKDYLKYNSFNLEREGMSFSKELVKRYGGKGRILEVGCGMGHFLAEIKRHCDWEAFGVDISEYAINFAKERFGFSAISGTIEEVKFDDNFFDVVYLQDILEHVLEPVNFLKEIYRILKPGGVIYLFIPVGELDVKPFLRAKKGIRVSPHWHLTFFHLFTIRCILVSVGFRVEKIKRLNFVNALVDLGMLSSERENGYSNKLRSVLSKIKLLETIGNLFLGHELKILAVKI